MPKLKKPIEISRKGRFTAMTGEVVDFTDERLADIVAVYDPAKHQAPLVVGHPKTDDPAYGWVSGLSFADDVLRVPEVEQLDAAFADLVNAGRFNRISASFFPPDAPNNPVPGHMYLKHVGFLGAAAPAVKGLKPVQFADDDACVTVEFAAVEGWTLASAFGSIGNMLSGIRDYFTEHDGAEKAEELMPRWRLDDLQATAERVRQQTADDPAFTDPPTPPKDTGMKDTDLQTREADLAKREAAQTAREAAFADHEAGARRRENEALIDGLIKDGRFVATQKPGTLAFMDGLNAAEATIDFADADGKTRKVSQLDAYREQLKASPKLVEFGEHTPGDDPTTSVDFAAPAGCVVDPEGLALHAKAQAYMTKHPDTDYLAAVKAVGGK